MRILIVQPTTYSFKSGKLIKRKHKKGICPPLVLAHLASFMPKNSQIDIIDEVIGEIDYNKKYDLVCISVLTPSAVRAYEISRVFREKNIPVIMGGHHMSLVPEEGEKFADAVVVGEIECVWKRFLDDFNRGDIQKRYNAEGRFNMLSMNSPRFDLIEWPKYKSFYGVKVPLETSRGCIHDCSFCDTRLAYKGGVIYRPIGEIIEDIERKKKEFKRISRPFFVFADDNLTSNLDRTYELFNALSALKIKWRGNFTSLAASDEKLMQLASRAGCYSITVGIESLDSATLKRVEKIFNTEERCIKCIKNCRENNIILTVGIIFGFPEDTPDVIYDTTAFFIKHKVPLVMINPLYPVPGTAIYMKLKKEKLLYEENFWLKPHNPFRLYKNENFSKGKINFEEAYDIALNRLYRYDSILRRSAGIKKFFPLLAVNLILRKRFNKESFFAHF